MNEQNPYSSQEMEAYREQIKQDLAKSAVKLARYESVRQMVVLQGWETFVVELKERADAIRKDIEAILDGMLLSDDSTLKARYLQAKVSFLAVEAALSLYISIREEAQKAKIVLDNEGTQGPQSAQ